MADKEIGLIQIRNGKQRNLPTALEHAELALTTDEGRMFVGLPATVTPASLVAGRRKNTSSGSSFVVQGSGEENIEILTEFTPQHVFDRVLYQAIRVTVPADDGMDPGRVTLQIPYTSRLFLDYVAFPESLDVLESGTATIVVIDNNSGNPATFPVLVDQQNNNNDELGTPNISIDPDSIQLTTAYMSVDILNELPQEMTFEYVTRGWGSQ